MKNILSVPVFSNLNSALDFSDKNQNKSICIQFIALNPIMIATGVLIKGDGQLAPSPILIYKQDSKDQVSIKADCIYIFLTPSQHLQLIKEVK